MYEEQGPSTDERVTELLVAKKLPVKRCGLNADWCVSAWHLSPGKPNVTSGDAYLLDEEDTDLEGNEMFSIVRRVYAAENSEDNDDVQVLYGPDTLDAVVNCWVETSEGRRCDSTSHSDGEQSGDGADPEIPVEGGV